MTSLRVAVVKASGRTDGCRSGAAALPTSRALRHPVHAVPGPALRLWTEAPCALQRSAALPSRGKTLPGSPGANCRGHSSGPTGTPALLEARRGRTPRVAPACGSPALPRLRKDTKLGAARLGQEPGAGGTAGCGCCVRHRPLLQVSTSKDLPEGDDLFKENISQKTQKTH